MLSLFGNAVSAARSAGALATDATRRVADAGIGARDAVVGLGNDAVGMAVTARDTVVGTAVAAKDAVVDTATSARDTVVETKDTVVGYTSAAADVAVIVASGLAFKSFVVAAIVAPIPTLVGALILDVMWSQVSERVDEATGEMEARRLARENARILDKLAKYGRIPATALVETPTASLRLDTVAGTVSGHVKTGVFSSRAIEGMTEGELREFAAGADEETAKLVDSYLRYRARTAIA